MSALFLRRYDESGVVHVLGATGVAPELKSHHAVAFDVLFSRLTACTACSSCKGEGNGQYAVRGGSNIDQDAVHRVMSQDKTYP